MYEYKPTRFMLPTSHYDKKKADRAVTFIQSLKHTKGKWEGKNFILFDWQDQIIRDIFGIVKEDGTRQFRQAYVEIPKKNGKSELAAAIALYMLFADNEPSAEVYSAAADRSQASIVFDVAKRMVELSPALLKRSKIASANKRIVNHSNNGIYQVLSADVGTKHGLNVSALIFDELHTQPNRQLYDVLTKGSSDARTNALHFFITTAGNNKNSICYELHLKARDILDGRKIDSNFYPVIFGLDETEDWHNEENWYKANPSLGLTIDIERVREGYQDALTNIAEENIFRQLRLNTWVNSNAKWMSDDVWMKCNFPVDISELEGRTCYAGLDLSSTTDITALVLVFPPTDEDDKYFVVPYFWIPEDTITQRVKRDKVPYDIWKSKGLVFATEGNVVHYEAIINFILKLNERFHLSEISYDRWNSSMLIQKLQDEGLTCVPMGQGFSSMSVPTKELMKLVLEQKIAHGGNEPLRWMMGNAVVKTDPAANIKLDKEKSTERIDGAVALVMALDRALRHGSDSNESVYDSRGLIFI